MEFQIKRSKKIWEIRHSHCSSKCAIKSNRRNLRVESARPSDVCPLANLITKLRPLYKGSLLSAVVGSRRSTPATNEDRLFATRPRRASCIPKNQSLAAAPSVRRQRHQSTNAGSAFIGSINFTFRTQPHLLFSCELVIIIFIPLVFACAMAYN